MRGDEEATAQHDVDLGHGDVRVRGDSEEDEVQAVVPDHDLGALVALDDVLGDEVVEREDVGQPREGRFGGVLDVHPDSRLRIGLACRDVIERADGMLLAGEPTLALSRSLPLSAVVPPSPRWRWRRGLTLGQRRRRLVGYLAAAVHTMASSHAGGGMSRMA